MPITEDQIRKIFCFIPSNSVEYSLSSPGSFTPSVSNIPQRLIIKVKNPAILPQLIEAISIQSIESTTGPLCVSMIGGGRGGSTNSYSIGNIWDGTDVFIQLTSEPTLELKDENICRISPNMMLAEINKKLYEQGYHCPMLCGALPFMTIAGGLSTKSHTSVGNLADIVQGIALLLPNGETEYFKRGDKDFDLVCNKATFGLLGVITGVDIKVKKGKKKLARVVLPARYNNFMRRIQEDSKMKTLESRCVIFSPYNLSKDTMVKTTQWKWVDDTMPDHGYVEPQIADDSFLSASVAPKLATHTPRLFSAIFNSKVTHPSLQGYTVAPADTIMGPESRLAGMMTEVAVFFDYDEKKIEDVLKRLEELLKHKQDQGIFPVNSAIFMRFPKVGGKHKVALDLVSLGTNLPELLPFTNEFICYLNSQGLHASVHYGKSHGISLNQAHDGSEEGWESLKEKYQAFYSEHTLETAALNKKIKFLEQASGPTPSQEIPDDEKTCDSYKTYCENQKQYLQHELDKLVREKYRYMDHYYSCEAIKRTGRDKYDFMLDDLKNKGRFGALSSDQRRDREKMQSDSLLSETLDKYKIVLSLQKKLTHNASPAKNIEAFHSKYDQTKNALLKNRNSNNLNVLKWLGTFFAGLLGCVILSYWTARAAHQRLNKTTTQSLLVDRVEADRAELYRHPRRAIR